MNYIKSILLIILLTPAISRAILYRIYTGNIGQDKAEFYFDYETAIYIDDKEHQVKELNFIRKNDNKYNFNTHYTDKFDEQDKIFIENFDSDTFEDGSDTYQYLTGYTFNGDKINLHKTFEYNKNGDRSLRKAEFNNIDYLQQESTKDFYFKVVVSKKKNEEEQIVGIKIYSKADGQLIQTIRGINGCKFNSYVSIAVTNNDYNFDGDNNDFFLVKDRVYGPNRTAEYYVYDKTQQQFVKLNLEGNDFHFDDEEKAATSYKTCPGKKENDEISLTDHFKYIGNNRYKHVKTECVYHEHRYLNEDNNQFEFKNQRACKPKELTSCRNYIDNNDYDDY